MAERVMAEKRRGGDQMGREWHCGRESGSSPGCMGGMFQHLHFHHLLFAANSSCCRVPSASSPPSSSSSSSSSSLPSRIDRTTLQEHKGSILVGLEAPRNSLELDEGKASSSDSSAMEEEFKDVPVAVEIVPPPASLSRTTNKTNIAMFAEEKKRPSCSSQAETPRTPSLVARLMGLEVSAEQSPSPTPKTPPLVERRPQAKKTKAVLDYHRRIEPPPPPRQPLQNLNCNRVGVIVDVGSRSLPESPRTSTSARYYDVDRRLSLQIYKENISYLREAVGDYSFHPPSPPCSSTKPKKKDSRRCANDENKSLIVKKANENLDDDVKSKSRRTMPQEKKLPAADQRPSSICSPQIRFTDYANSSDGDDIKKRPLMALPKPSKLGGGGGGDRDHGEATVVKVVVNKCKKADHERFTGRIKNQTPHSQYGSRSFPTLATLFQATPDQRNLPDKNSSSSLPSIFASSRVQEASQATSLPLGSAFGGGLKESNTEKDRPPRARKDKNAEFIYIKSILERAKIVGARTGRWYSRSLPIDPIVFHRLELEFPFFLIGEGERRKGSGEEDWASRRLLGQLRHRWNRKLLFHLVQEILGDLLVGSSNLSSAATNSLIRRENRSAADGEALLRELVSRIESFPAADCRVVGDIDALVAGDMAEANVRRLPLHASVAEEAGDVVSEVEREILDGLLGETAASIALAPPPLHRGGGGSIGRSTGVSRRYGGVLTETAGREGMKPNLGGRTPARSVHVGDDPTLPEKKRT